MNCLLCHRQLRDNWSLRFLLLPKKYQTKTVCEACLTTFRLIEPATCCPGCGRQQALKQVCGDCQKWQTHSSMAFSNVALFEYNAAMKQFMHAYKFQGDYRLRAAFNVQFSQFVQEQQNAALLVALPIDEQTWQTRGFNQVSGLLDGLALKAPLLMNRSKSEKRQSQKSRWERLETSNHFQIDVEYPEQIKNKEILLIDDVYTTGRTLRHAAQTLLEAGCATVRSVTLCR
ncbi:phosphoribosyltransferase family protein [Pediococcus siamensis]|uniref:ComF family protein n=1 Tax=Pediococcus siamensis TaxID=381829 RepID=UPI00399F1B5E